MVASLVTSSRSRRRRSVTSRTSTSAPMCSPCGRSGMARTISETDSVPISVSRWARPPSTALSVSSSGRRRGGTSSRVTSASTQPVEVAGEAEPAVDRQRVGAGVDDPALLVDAQEAVADPRRVGVVAALARAPGSGRRRSSGSGRPRSAGRTAPGGSGCGRRAGWCCGRPPRSPGRPRRTGIVSTRTGTSSRHSGSPSRTSRPSAYAGRACGRRPAGDEGADDVVDVRRRAGRRPHLAARPEPASRRGRAATAPGRRRTGRR